MLVKLCNDHRESILTSLYMFTPRDLKFEVIEDENSYPVSKKNTKSNLKILVPVFTHRNTFYKKFTTDLCSSSSSSYLFYVYRFVLTPE